MKNPNLIVIDEDCLRLRMTDLKKMGFLRPDAMVMCRLSWGDAMSVHAIVMPSNTKMTLDYQYRGKPTRCSITIIARTANLGFGTVYYFECPVTKRLCRYLYFYGGQWVSRHAIPNAMYKSQTRARDDRRLYQAIDQPFRRKWQKIYYRGKLTSTHQRLLSRQLRWYENAVKWRVHEKFL